MATIVDEKKYTKISISRDLHNLVKKICGGEGLKMYHFEDEAIRKYIKENWPIYANNGAAKMLLEINKEI